VTAHLELSQKYERKIKRTKSTIGLTAAYKALDNLTARQLDLEQQIMSTRCAARSDFTVKLAICDLHGRDDSDAASAMRTSVVACLMLPRRRQRVAMFSLSRRSLVTTAVVSPPKARVLRGADAITGELKPIGAPGYSGGGLSSAVPA
jgi:hypothetical protein